MIQIHYVITVLSTVWLAVSHAEDCIKIGPCSCAFSKTYIDLSPMVSGPGPKFKDVPDQKSGSQFSYNPCFGFNEGTCKNVAVCQFYFSNYFPCGSQESATFSTDATSRAVTIKYSSNDGTTLRTSLVKLTCKPDASTDTLIVSGESPATFYNYELQSKYACEKEGKVEITVSISVGSILVIIFFATLFLYLIAGILFQKVGRKASGKEIIPNHTLWFAVPSLVKDGFRFTFTCGKGAVNYQAI